MSPVLASWRKKALRLESEDQIVSRVLPQLMPWVRLPGTGQVDFNEVMRGWKESPGHNKNLLLGDATHMGIALVQDPRTEFKSFWTLVIGSSM